MTRARLPPDPRDQPLTAREREVLALLATGQTNKEVARALGISYDTAKQHLDHCYRKLGVTNRVGAVLAWMQFED